MSDQPDGWPLPEWHLTIAEERLADYERNPDSTRDAYAVLSELSERVHLKRESR
jgi:hypothetical protein